MNENNKPDVFEPIEYRSEVTESTSDHQYSNAPQNDAGAPTEQTALSIIGLILALPFPILVVILWATLSIIKEQNQALSNVTMNAVFLYLLQFFVIPLLSIVSIIIGFKVTLNSKAIAKKIGYVSFGVTTVGFILLGIFLNHS